MEPLKAISGQIVDIHQRRIFPGSISIENGIITEIKELAEAPAHYIMPGFIDAHIHIESSMLVPYEFARIALKHGTVATISDPHEIANVLGIDGVVYMLENAKGAKLKFHFGAPSCVPATTFETAGAIIDADGVETLLKRDDIFYLSEMMNYPGVLFEDSEVMKKIALAKKYNKPVDGHAPGLMGADAEKYIAAGISTDHECFTLEEALGKLKHGMKILIREGSAARNYNALHTLIKSHAKEVMFCCDDKHPDELLLFHIDEHVRKSIALGYDLFDVLQIASVNPVNHYKMNVGLLREGDKADFICVKDLTKFEVIKTVIDGEVVAEAQKTFLPDRKHSTPNQFNIQSKTASDFSIKAEGTKVRTIIALDGQLITQEETIDATIKDGYLIADPSKDLLKIAVVNRYSEAPVAVAFIKNFGLREGAIASSVAHDSHNIIIVGADDAAMAKAANLIIAERGGLSLVSNSEEMVIGLPVAGLMSDRDCETIGNAYAKIDHAAKALGSSLKAPYMLLSFMALLVIPQLKLSDKGLFDGSKFVFTELQLIR
ncbi:MAG TPA: adenine deaminase [Bacteroidia bacterium]|jgi:adenine deaminase|nr:adenine deaminase [Bacteroidia bacterium]HQF29425.1 adenine deaminase [Bacteroidia bacterium]HQK97508.1 adenine deaminase [Bacteroidia bacterium]